MSDIPVLIIHGWSDKSDSFEPLAAFLRQNGHQVIDIWLADYISMRDEITIYDLGNAMTRALKAQKIPQTRHSFDVIVHSTGGLVIRQYLIQNFFGKPHLCPVKRLLMLAPANFGSPLAGQGQSVLGRFLKGWKWDGIFQTGQEVLNALKLASPISFEMAELDLFNPNNVLFSPEHIYTTVLIGSEAYEGMRSVVHENGTDGTVRVATANLNATYLKIIFDEDPQVEPVVQKIEKCYDPIAFAVVPGHTHGSITKPESPNYPQLGGLMLKSLSIQSPDEYINHVNDLAAITKQTFDDGILTDHVDWYHQYQHVVTRVHDQFGAEIPDYMLEFFQEKSDDADKVMTTIHREVLEKVSHYAPDSGYRSFFFDITDLETLLLKTGHQVEMSLCAAALSELITYVDPKGYLTVAGPLADQQTLLKPNTPLMVDIQLPRIQNERVFTLRKSEAK